jgi:hypothetical protein
MKKLAFLLCAVAFAFGIVGPVNATVLFQDGFENPWAGDYAPGWVNSAYRHGAPPVGKMMQQTTTSHSGSFGLQLTADSVPESWMWWAAVEVESLPLWAMAKQYNPYVSVWYYDKLGNESAGQVYAVPEWVNLYIGGTEDWTDVQYGGRFGANNDNYYHVTAGENNPGWQDTGVARTKDWHNLMFQLDSTDGYIHFYLDGTGVGLSTRNDYTDLGTAIGLYTMFTPPLSEFGDNKPFTIWDDFEVGSQAQAPVPEPATMLLLGSGLAGLVGFRKKFRKS